MNMKHTLTQRSPSEKATKECLEAVMDVYSLLYPFKKSDGFEETSSVDLGNGGCAVMATVSKVEKIVEMMDLIKRTSKSYSYLKNERTGAFVNVWVSKKPKDFVDGKGKAIDTAPSTENCETARKELQSRFDNISFRTVVNRKPTSRARRCYVDAIFGGANHSQMFEQFMRWNAPGGDHEPMNWYIDEGKDSVKVVYVHAVDSYQK